MPSFALPNTGLLDLLTLSDGGDPPPVWAREWAESVAVHAHIDVGKRRASRRNLWAVRLDEAVRRAEQPVLIVAYGVSCFALAWWARLSPAPYFERVAGALMVRPLGASAARGYAGPKTALPFASIVVGDGEGDMEARRLAQSWGSAFTGFDGFDRDEEGLGARALRLGTGLIERLMPKPSFAGPNQRSDCAPAAL